MEVRVRIFAEGESRVEIAKRKGNKFLSISMQVLCVLIYFIAQGCNSAPVDKDSKGGGYTESGKASYCA